MCRFNNLVVDLLQEGPYFFAARVKSDSDSGVNWAEKKKDTWDKPLICSGCLLQLMRMIKYIKDISGGTPCKIPVVILS